MARVADQPGTYRVLNRKAGGVLLSGVRNNGERVKVKFTSKGEADSFAASSGLFSGKSEAPKPDWTQTDDWGFPLRVSETSAASVGVKLGLNKPPDAIPSTSLAVTPKSESATEREESRAKRASKAKSLAEMIGMAGAMGDVMLATRLTEAAGKVPVKVNPTQVKDLADSLKETIVEWFGDRDIKPWQMTILLALGIPLTMLLQSKPVEKPAESPKSSVAK